MDPRLTSRDEFWEQRKSGRSRDRVGVESVGCGGQLGLRGDGRKDHCDRLDLGKADFVSKVTHTHLGQQVGQGSMRDWGGQREDLGSEHGVWKAKMGTKARFPQARLARKKAVETLGNRNMSLGEAKVRFWLFFSFLFRENRQRQVSISGNQIWDRDKSLGEGRIWGVIYLEGRPGSMRRELRGHRT